MEDKIYTMPAVALRGMTILPGMVAHFDISRERSIKAVETAMMGDQLIFLVTQKNANEENPQVSDLFSIGVVANIRQVIKLQNDIVRVLVEGSNRAELYEFTEETEYIEARIISYESQNDEDLPEQAASAMCMSVQETFAKYAKLHGKSAGKWYIRRRRNAISHSFSIMWEIICRCTMMKNRRFLRPSV